MAADPTKQKILQTIDQLPPEGVKELAQYLDFLQYKYRVREPRKVVALGGLWKDLDFDVTDEEVRALRQRVSQHALARV